MKTNLTKQKVVDEAAVLFYQKGFHGTSVRDIAEAASVNVSLISYYFKSKQGLLEYAVTHYYERYFTYLAEELEQVNTQSVIIQLQHLVKAMMTYKTRSFQLTSFIDRELTLDSTFVREMSVTYLAKENSLLKSLFIPILPKEKRRYQSYYYMQLKGMLAAPYIFKNEWHYKGLADKQALQSFIDHYTKTIYEWIIFTTEQDIHE